MSDTSDTSATKTGKRMTLLQFSDIVIEEFDRYYDELEAEMAPMSGTRELGHCARQAGASRLNARILRRLHEIDKETS